MIVRAILAGALAALACTSLTACQSTQSRSAELEEDGAKVLLDSAGLKVTKQNPDVKVLSTTLVKEGQESAVVVEVRNESRVNLVDVPITVDVLDRRGRSVYSNDAPGLEQALVAIPYIPANGTAVWVNDQILASGVPAKAEVKVGMTPNTFSGPLPDIEVSAPRLEGGGLIASGHVVNRTGEDQKRLVLYAVARRGGEVVAAGRGAIEHLKPVTKEIPYHVYFIGPTDGAEVTLSSYPTLKAAEAGGA